MDDLVAFLKARLDEDDDEAHRGYLKAEPIPDYDGWDKRTTAGLPPAVAARVLREVEAKRRVVSELEHAEFTLSRAGDSGTPYDLMTGAVNSYRHAIRMLAAAYADHPGYRPEWSPAA